MLMLPGRGPPKCPVSVPGASVLEGKAESLRGWRFREGRGDRPARNLMHDGRAGEVKGKKQRGCRELLKKEGDQN